MSPTFSSHFFTGNRQRLRQSVGEQAFPIVLTANGLLQRGGDSTFLFAQDASFWYLTGVEEPDITLVMEAGNEYLIVPSRDESRMAFDGVVDAQSISQRSGIATVLEEEEGWQRLTAILKVRKAASTVTAPPAYIERYGMYTNPARARLAERLQELRPSLQLTDIATELVLLRMVKRPEEIAAIRKAIAITTDTLQEITANVDTYHYEYELEADLTRGFRRRGGQGHAFEPIVAAGARACVLHNVANNGALTEEELLVLDVGAEYSHYAADITRTYAYGSATQRQRDVHAAVVRVQSYGFSLLQPGMTLKEFESRIVARMADELAALKLIKKGDVGAVRTYYPHATSHFLGLNVHDVGDYDKPLEPGNVLTVEPGIYIAAEGIGVRIEDDVLITESGIEILSDALPRHLG